MTLSLLLRICFPVPSMHSLSLRGEEMRALNPETPRGNACCCMKALQQLIGICGAVALVL